MNSSKVAIIGLGYVGLPLAVHFAERGHTVLGLDKDIRKIDSIIKGESYIPDVSSKELQSLLTKKLTVNTPDQGIADFQNSDYVIVTVPTPINEQREPDLSALISASHYIQQNLQKGQTFILKAPHIQAHLKKSSYLLFLKMVKGRGRFLYRIFLRELIQQIVNIQFKLFQKLLVDKQKSVNKRYRIYIVPFLTKLYLLALRK